MNETKYQSIDTFMKRKKNVIFSNLATKHENCSDSSIFYLLFLFIDTQRSSHLHRIGIAMEEEGRGEEKNCRYVVIIKFCKSLTYLEWMFYSFWMKATLNMRIWLFSLRKQNSWDKIDFFFFISSSRVCVSFFSTTTVCC